MILIPTTAAKIVSQQIRLRLSGDRDFIVSEDGVDLTSVTNKDHKARRKVALFDKASRRYEKEKKNSNSMSGTHPKRKNLSFPAIP